MASAGGAQKTIVIGSRGSRLALAQAEEVRAGLARFFPKLKIRIKIIKTLGDKLLSASLAVIGGKGVFVKELEQALSSGRIDLAVHSLKDLPTEIPRELKIGAVTKREDPRDVLVTSQQELVTRVRRIGTSSLRRKTQLLRWKPGLKIVDIRGNLDTRIRKLEEMELDGIVVAMAGLKRLFGNSPHLNVGNLQPISLSRMLPAVGQGFLAIEIRRNDRRVQWVVAKLNNARARFAAEAERALLKGLGGGCQMPVGALAKVRGKRLSLQAIVASPDGKTILRASKSGPVGSAERIGEQAAKILLSKGAGELLKL